MAKRSKASASAGGTLGGLQRGATEFNPDYTNTKKELRRIATLAGVFFVVLIALYFILPLIQK
jgi:hypothetical protein